MCNTTLTTHCFKQIQGCYALLRLSCLITQTLLLLSCFYTFALKINPEVTQKERPQLCTSWQRHPEAPSRSPGTTSSQLDVGSWGKYRGEARVQLRHKAFKVPGGLGPKHIQQLPVHQSKPGAGNRRYHFCLPHNTTVNPRTITRSKQEFIVSKRHNY